MARARKSHKSDEENAKPKRSGLQPPYRQVGHNPYVIYTSYHPPDVDYPKVVILNFAEKYAAKYFLDQLIAGGEYEWIKPVGSRSQIKTDFGIKISMDGDTDLKMLLKYEPTALEAEWEDSQVQRHVANLKYGRTAEDRGSVTDEETGEVIKKPKQKKEKKVKEPKVKIDKTNMVSANDIAKEMGVEGREVRGVLRALKLEKPEGGWLFDKKTSDDIRAKVKKGLKEAKEKKKEKKKKGKKK